MNRPVILSATFVRTVRQPGRYGDGRGSHGLALVVRVTANGRLSKSWIQRVRIGGRETNLGLGTYPVLSLAEAREAALENRRAIAQGIDPRSGGVPTFAEAVEAVIALHAAGWRDAERTATDWRRTLARHVFPAFGNRPVSEVTSTDIHGVLGPLATAKFETARKLRGRISTVLSWAVAEGHRTDDPTPVVTKAMARNGNGVHHFKALPAEAVGEAIATVRASGAWWATVACYQLIALTGCRGEDARGATWAEIDTGAAVWSIPPERYKTGTGLRVPLSGPALAILADARERTGGDPDGLVFPSRAGRQLSDSTMSKLVRELGIPGTVHGMRSSLRSWCADTGVRREVAEMVLGPRGPGVEGAYQRSDLLAQRREVADVWAAYIG